MYRVEQIAFRYHRGARALDNVSFHVQQGEWVGIVGRSGSGKSTLARCLSGLLPLENGTLRLNGNILSIKGKEKQRIFRRNVQMVFQDPFLSLPYHLPVGLPLSDACRIRLRAKEEAKEDLLCLLEALGLSPETWMAALNLENPGQEERMAFLAQLRAAIRSQIIIPAALQRLQQPDPFTPEQVTEIEGLMGGASPDLSQFLESQVGEQLPGPIRQVMANQARQGIPQATQRPQEVTGGAPVGV